MSYWGFKPYVSVAARHANALREIEKLRKKGTPVAPVAVDGAKIAKSFWGKAWCDNLERYSDYANRLPRGRSYVKHGTVIDLRVSRGRVEALVAGSETYKVKIDIAVAAKARWSAICADCAGSIGSIVELLQGKFAKHVMERVCREADGLFPGPKEIKMSCSCPDWAGMCKHVAATLYGVGARLDHDPDVLFTLRGVDRGDLVSSAGDLSICEAGVNSERVLVADDMAALFGLEFYTPEAMPAKKARGETAPASKRMAAPNEKFGDARSPAKSSAVRAKGKGERGSENGSAGKAIPVSLGRVEAKASRKAATSLKSSDKAVALAPDQISEAVQSDQGRRRARTNSEAASPSRKSEPSRSAVAKVKPKTISSSTRPPAPAPATRPHDENSPPQSRTRAARWIGAKARKAARN
jgi:uncharacterized Zn finger protein